MSRIKARVLKGFRDYMPENMLPKQKMLNLVANTFESFGFSPLQTPALEYAECLLGKYGDEGDKLLYRFLDNGERDVAMRYDLTVPLARVMGMNTQLTRPFKRYQIAPVWRAEKPGRGRFREFMQCDVDIIGAPDLMADAECILVGCSVLKNLGIDEFVIRINNRKLLTAMLSKYDIESPEDTLGVLRCIDKLPKIGEENVRKLLMSEHSLPASSVDGIFEFLDLEPNQLHAWFSGHELGLLGADELNELLKLLEELGVSDYVDVDLSIARGLDYYTGTIYETFLKADESLGSVMSGGRYDTLLSMFSGQEIPAVGISLGVDRLLYGLIEMGLLEAQASPSDALIGVFSSDERKLSYTVAEKLRLNGLNAEVYPGVARMKKQLQYANRQGIPFVILVGQSEFDRDEVILKNMKTGDQDHIKIDHLADHLQGG
ncbi:MAG: histidine--tRNA ligase [Myxococcales bacterium]|nr:histidine--tRNA ligase [Myxococcales bacterium]